MAEPASMRNVLVVGGAAVVASVLVSRLLFPPVTFHAVTPCRLVDTRQVGTQTTGKPLAGGQPHVFRVQGLCEVPNGVTAVVLNATVVSPSTGGDLRLFPADLPVPEVSTLNFNPGVVVANNAIVPLAPVARDTDKDLGMILGMGQAGSSHVLLDVTGYFK